MNNLLPMDVVQGQLDAYNRRDLDAFTRFYLPNVEIWNLSSKSAVMCGNLEIKERYGKLFADHPNLHAELKNRICVGSYVIDEEFVTGLPGHPAGLHVAAIYLVTNGLIEKVWFSR